MPDFKKVTIGFSPRDIETTAALQNELHARTKADAVSSALAIAHLIVSEMAKGNQIIIRDKSGKDVQQVRLPTVEPSA